MVLMSVDKANNNKEDELVEVNLPADCIAIGSIQKFNPEEEDVWLLQCPKGFNLSELKKQQVKVPGRTKVKEHTETVVTEFANGPRRGAFAYYRPKKQKYAVEVLPVRGSIIVRNRLQLHTDTATAMNNVENLEMNIEDTSSQNYVSNLPDLGKIPIRHPLLGHRFKECFKKMKPAIRKRLMKLDFKFEETSEGKPDAVNTKDANKFISEVKSEVLSDTDVEIVVPAKRRRIKH